MIDENSLKIKIPPEQDLDPTVWQILKFEHSD